ncbi:hypothetical protein GOBAR_DD04321 [Gossypium barbadense]|nr:hypothetical protein GOBAR_DD04321 [Gossypium barbadense]
MKLFSTVPPNVLSSAIHLKGFSAPTFRTLSIPIFDLAKLLMGEEGASSKVIAKVPAEFERVASTPKFKWRKVSAFRDFPPGCGRVVAPSSGSKMEFEDQEEQEEEMGLAPSYDPLANSSRVKMSGVEPGSITPTAGTEGTLDALKCAACNCHRNFHRKETELGSPHSQRPLALPSISGGGGGHSREDQDDVSNQGSSRKRFRTKFTQEQKEKMLALAERLGWRIQKQDEAIVQQFCNETGVKRHVFKVWMHNNKNTLDSHNSNSDVVYYL